jgi:hypothetical protein
MESRLEDIQQVFADMQTEGCNANAPLKWGHFFFDANLDALWGLYQELQTRGYQFESCHRDEDDEFVLQLSKTEVRTPEQLHLENLALESLAEKHSIASYDGWDAGRPEEEGV